MLQGRPEDVTLQGRPEDVTLQGVTFHAADAPDRNRISEFRHLPNFQLPHVHARHATSAYIHVYAAKCPVTPSPYEIAQRFFFGPSGGKSGAADPFSILPRSILRFFGELA